MTLKSTLDLQKKVAEKEVEKEAEKFSEIERLVGKNTLLGLGLGLGLIYHS
jgi:hypothetical protein